MRAFIRMVGVSKKELYERLSKEISETLREKLNEKLEEYGVEIPEGGVSAVTRGPEGKEYMEVSAESSDKETILTGTVNINTEKVSVTPGKQYGSPEVSKKIKEAFEMAVLEGMRRVNERYRQSS